MAFTVQASIGSVPGANAYCSVEFFKSYHTDRGRDFSTAADSEIETAIVRATDYLDTRFNFVGFKSIRTQRTEWPRISAYDADGNIVFGLPYEVTEACAEYAFIALSAEINPTPVRDDTGRSIKRKYEKVGPLEEETEFSGTARFEMPKYPVADRKLSMRGLIRSASHIVRG